MQEVRDDALQLLDALSSRVWKEAGNTVASVRPGTPLLPGQILHASPHAAVVIGALQDSFQDFQLRLSSKLARWVTGHCSLWLNFRYTVESVFSVMEGERTDVLFGSA